jgi:hypothetical protein
VKIKVSIPAMTVEVDVDDWSNEYGTEASAAGVREDVKSYFYNTLVQDHTVTDGLVTFLNR